MDEKLHKIRFDTEKAAKYFTKIMAYTVGPVELQDMMADKKVEVIDVRDKEDFDDGHIPNAISMPRAEMPDRLNELSKDKLYVVYCYNQQCHLGACACRFLAVNHYHAMHLDGGFKVWSEDFKFDVQK